MVKDHTKPPLNIGEIYVFSVVKLLRNDCENLVKVNVHTHRFAAERGILLSHLPNSFKSNSMIIDASNPLFLLTQKGLIPGFGEQCLLAALMDTRCYTRGKMQDIIAF